MNFSCKLITSHSVSLEFSCSFYYYELGEISCFLVLYTFLTYADTNYQFNSNKSLNLTMKPIKIQVILLLNIYYSIHIEYPKK